MPLTKPNQTSFKHGNPGGGRKPMSADLKAIRDSTREGLFNSFSFFAGLTEGEILDIENGNKHSEVKLSLLNEGIIKSLRMFKENGETKHIEYMLNQIIGKPRESIELSGGLEIGDKYKEQRQKIADIKKRMSDQAEGLRQVMETKLADNESKE